MLQGVPIAEVPLDFIETKYFGDLYLPKESLGAGGFGVVLKVKEIASGDYFAMKIIPKQNLNIQELKTLTNEAKLLAKITHPAIVKLINFHESKEFVFMVMEMALSGSLRAYIDKNKLTGHKISDADCSCIIKQVLEGIEYCHERNIIHRDINPKNILLKSFDNLHNSARIADFGLGIELTGYNVYGTSQNCGTLVYMAPEQVAATLYKSEVDMWAIGVLMYELMCGHHPLCAWGDSPSTFVEKLMNPHFEFSSDFSELAIDFFLRLCRVMPQRRYSATEALKHPWITRMNDTDVPLSIYDKVSLDIQTKELRGFFNACIYLSTLPTAERVLNKEKDEEKAPKANAFPLIISLEAYPKNKLKLKHKQIGVSRTTKAKDFFKPGVTHHSLNQFSLVPDPLRKRSANLNDTMQKKKSYTPHNRKIINCASVNSLGSAGSVRNSQGGNSKKIISFSDAMDCPDSPNSAPFIYRTINPEHCVRSKLSKFAPKKTIHKKLEFTEEEKKKFSTIEAAAELKLKRKLMKKEAPKTGLPPLYKQEAYQIKASLLLKDEE